MKTFFALIIGLFFISFSASAVVIKDLKILDNKRISKETIITYGDIKLNKDYNEKELNQIIKNLYETNFFKNLNLQIKDQIMILKVVENKIIQNVLVEGVKSKRIKEAILKNLFSKDKSPFLIEKLAL